MTVGVMIGESGAILRTVASATCGPAPHHAEGPTLRCRWATAERRSDTVPLPLAQEFVHTGRRQQASLLAVAAGYLEPDKDDEPEAAS